MTISKHAFTRMTITAHLLKLLVWVSAKRLMSAHQQQQVLIMGGSGVNLKMVLLESSMSHVTRGRYTDLLVNHVILKSATASTTTATVL